MEDFVKNIYRKVTKGRKPFKSGKLYNIVKGVINHPILNVPAYTFFDDDSYVECKRCKVVEPKKLIIKNTPIAFESMKENFGSPALYFFNQYYLYFIPETKEWGTEMDFGYLYAPEPMLTEVSSIIEQYKTN